MIWVKLLENKSKQCIGERLDKAMDVNNILLLCIRYFEKQKKLDYPKRTVAMFILLTKFPSCSFDSPLHTPIHTYHIYLISPKEWLMIIVCPRKFHIDHVYLALKKMQLKSEVFWFCTCKGPQKFQSRLQIYFLSFIWFHLLPCFDTFLKMDLMVFKK